MEKNNKRILGLDLGPNSIGWALIEIDHTNKTIRIINLGVRVLPMDSAELSKFNIGAKIDSAAKKRNKAHRVRITRERYLLRRERLHLVLNLLEALPEHYKLTIDFKNKKGMRSGKFRKNIESKLAYVPTKNEENKHTFLFEAAFKEMIEDLQSVNPNIKDEKKERIPKDWTLYYLRQKALNEKITLEELAWVLLSYNQKRGTEIVHRSKDEKDGGGLKEILDLKVTKVERKEDKRGIYFEVTLNDSENTKYKEYSTEQLTFEGDIKEVTKVLKKDDDGNIKDEDTIIIISDLYNLQLVKIEKEETNDKSYKFRYHFHYKNGWTQTKKSAKENYAFEVLKQKLEKDKEEKSELYIITTKYDIEGNPLEANSNTSNPSIKLPDFNSENSEDWTLLKLKTEKEAIKFNIKEGYINENGSSKHFISPKIYEVIKNDVKNGTKTKIIGGLFQTIDRKFYREELTQIINTQRKFHTETLDDKTIFEKCVKLLYPNNEQHADMLLRNKQQITNLLVEDILLYQRPLESKKTDVADCKFEINFWKEIVDKSTGEIKEVPVYKKAVSISHPLYQEFRIWDKIHNIKLIQIEQRAIGEKTKTNVDVTSQYFTEEVYQKLFHFFNEKESIKMNQFLTFCEKEFKINIGKKGARNFVWNYPEEEEFKGNETRKSFYNRFKRCGFKDFEDFMTQQKEIELWHYLYSVSSKDRKSKSVSPYKEGRTSMQNFFIKYFKDYEISDEVFDKLCKDFENYPKFESKYGAYSEKALKKLLSVMRVGDNFITKEESGNALRNFYLSRINYILEKLPSIDWEDENFDYSKILKTEINLRNKELPFPKGLFSVFRQFNKVEDFKFLNLTNASYLLYGRHSELAHIKYWNTPEKIRQGIREEVKQHSLNNPIAEKVIKEMMNLVADIWDYYGEGKENFFHTIHLEVARELQKSNKERKEIFNKQEKNRKENERLRNIIKDFLQYDPYNAKVGNKDHFERLKLVEEATQNLSEKTNDINVILQKRRISKTDFEKYKLWVEQGYKSPYTGEFIKLTDLFNGDKYNVDHIFPRALVTNDSLNNKIVCEATVNRFKSARTGREFILQEGGRRHKIFDDTLEKEVEFNIISETEYEDLIRKQFKGMKKYILLSNEVPNGFTNSQLNTTKYIARKAMELLSHIVREEGEVEYRAKRVLPISGAITSILRNEWKFNEIWTELLIPRFQRINELQGTKDYGEYNLSKNGHSYFQINTDFIKEKNKDFDIKRLDHRHHALDALIVALCTTNHIQYINNVNSDITNSSKDRIDAIKRQRESVKRKIQYSQPKKENPKHKEWKYMLPGSFRMKGAIENGKDSVINLFWEYGSIENKILHQRNYKKAVLKALENVVVSFKQNLRVINKATNYYEKYVEENGKLVKKKVKQEGVNWAIRKPLHKETVSGKISLDRVNVAKNKILTANRKPLDATFNEKNISSITDTGIQQILLNYLKYKGSSELAFSPEGLEEMNKNIAQFNNGKNHKPIYKVRVFEEGSKFSLGEKGTKSTKYVEAAKGTNLYFGIYVDEKGTRSYATIPLNEVIERQKKGLSSCPETDEKGNKLLFSLSPNDLVYVPTEDENVEMIDFENLTKEQKKRLYNVNDFTSSTCYFVSNTMSKAIFPKEADLKLNKGKLSGSYDTKTASFEGKQIKDICIKLKVDRLGNISKF